METEPDLLLDKVDIAMSQQSWREAWALLEQANPSYHGSDRHLGARRQDFLMYAAHCMRHKGQFKSAMSAYQELIKELALDDYRIAEALMGKAELLHAQNNFGEALQTLRAANYVPRQPQQLQLRMATTHAHIYSHLEIDKSLKLFEQAQKSWQGKGNMLSANLTFWHADALLIAGLYEQAKPLHQDAKETSQREGCAVTLADAMRRMPLLNALTGDRTGALADLADLANAKELYKASGDRGEIYLHTESGEVHRSLGKLKEAEIEFERGLWAAREIGDANRVGHNQLGLYELSRQAGRAKTELLEEARRSYHKADSQWGLIHCMISEALNDKSARDKLKEQAEDLAQQSSFSSFSKELELMDWICQAPENLIRKQIHLMNYP
jgi:tetratricopeptide (TPR) repeat protein